MATQAEATRQSDNKEETYTTDEVKELIRQAYVDGYENGYVKGVWYDKIEKFYKEHLKKKSS